MIQLILLLVGLLLSMIFQVQAHAEVISQTNDKSRGSDFGRLFSSPNERQSLDYVRKTKKEMVPKVAEETQLPMAITTPKPIVMPDKITVQGYVKRSDGVKSTVWINGEPMQEKTSNDELVLGTLPKTGNKIPIKVKASGKSVRIKAGQAYQPETNRIKEMSSLHD